MLMRCDDIKYSAAMFWKINYGCFGTYRRSSI